MEMESAFKWLRGKNIKIIKRWTIKDINARQYNYKMNNYLNNYII